MRLVQQLVSRSPTYSNQYLSYALKLWNLIVYFVVFFFKKKIYSKELIFFLKTKKIDQFYSVRPHDACCVLLTRDTFMVDKLVEPLIKFLEILNSSEAGGAAKKFDRLHKVWMFALNGNFQLKKENLFLLAKEFLTLSYGEKLVAKWAQAIPINFIDSISENIKEKRNISKEVLWSLILHIFHQYKLYFKNSNGEELAIRAIKVRVFSWNAC